MRRQRQYSRADGQPVAAARKRTDERRGSACSRGYTRRWRAYRARFLQEYPVCIRCQSVLAEVVDHILPVRQASDETSGSADELFWPAWNHQPVCRTCHRIKTDQHDARLLVNRLAILTQIVTSDDDENARRNELLQRAEIWDRWIDLGTGAEVNQQID